MTARIVSVRGSGLTLWGVRPKPLAPRPVAKVLDTSRGRFEIDPIDVGDYGWSVRMTTVCTADGWHGRPLDTAHVTDGFARHVQSTATTVPWPAFTSTSWVQYTGRAANAYWRATTTNPRGDGSPRVRRRLSTQPPIARNPPAPATEETTRVATPESDSSVRPT